MSKTTKKTSSVVITSTGSSGSTSIGSGSMGQTQRPQSPLSPTRYSRLQEKVELQNLNDRLACYMDKVRSLEAENNRLTQEVRISEETVNREVTAFKSMYDQELAETRRSLDDIAKEKAQVEIYNKRLSEENEELKSSLDKKTKECRALEASLSISEHRSTDLQSKYNQVAADRKKLDDELKDALKELEKLRKSYEMTKKYIENEALVRVELENKIQSLKEEAHFKDQIYQKEIGELRMKRREEITEIDGRLTVQYEDKLQSALQELREQHEQQQMANREEIMSLYETKIKNLQDHFHRSSMALQNSGDELRTLQTKYNSLNGQIASLEVTNAALNSRIKELEKMLEGERTRKMEQLTQLEQEIARLRQEMSDQLKDYHDLMDIKVALDTEISAYRKLLEFEENRLNLMSSFSNVSSSGSSSNPMVTRRGTPLRSTPLPMAKRRRIFMEESQEMDSYQVTGDAKGDVEISDVHPEGKFIQLHNKSDKEISLSGWSIKHSAGSEEKETTFKFHRSVKLYGKGNVTVWSMDSNHTHSPPEHILMKQKWFMGDSVVTVLINNDGEEVASRQRQKVHYSTSAYRREREGSVDTQDGDPKRDSCRLM